MTTKTNKTAFDAFVADMNAAQTRVAGDEHGAADMAAHLAVAIADAETGGNYPKLEGAVTRVTGKGKDRKSEEVTVTVDVERVLKFAAGNLSQTEVTETLDALASLSPKVQQARKAYADLMELPKADRAQFAAEIAAAKTKAHSLTQTLRRPLRAAAFLIAADGFDVSTAHAKMSKGSRLLHVTRTIKAGDNEVTKTVTVSTKQVDDGLTKIAADAGNVKKKRAPQTGSNKPADKPASINDAWAKVTARGGDRKKLAGIMGAQREAFKKMTDTFTAPERHEVIALILQMESQLDALGQKELAAERKKRAI